MNLLGKVVLSGGDMNLVAQFSMAWMAQFGMAVDRRSGLTFEAGLQFEYISQEYSLILLKEPPMPALHQTPVGASVPEPGCDAHENSDRFVAEARKIGDQDEHLLAAVFDGVSSSPDRQAAAEIAAEFLREAFSAWDGRDADDFLRDALRDANQRILRQFPGGTARCTAAVALLQGAHVRIAHVGDSRVYLVTEHQLEALTEDHSQAVPVMIGGTMAMRGGQPFIARGLTRVLGIGLELEPEVQAKDIPPGSILAVATDGALPSGLRPWLEKLGRDALPETLVEHCQRMAEESQDDTTVVVLRAALPQTLAQAQSQLARYADLDGRARDALLLDLEKSDVPPVPDALLQALHLETDDQRSARLIEQCPAESLSREIWVSLLDQAILSGRKAAARSLRERLRRL